MSNERKNQAKVIRWNRKIHRLSGITFFLFLLLIGITGILLGWKKNSGGIILPHTQTGVSTSTEKWLPIDSLIVLSTDALKIETDISATVDRVDVRPDKGIAKVRFDYKDYSVQIDGQTGEVLQIQRRYSDLLERIHDGTIVDDWLGIKNGWFKLFYSTVMGVALMCFCLTGFWLWYGPKRMKKSR